MKMKQRCMAACKFLVLCAAWLLASCRHLLSFSAANSFLVSEIFPHMHYKGGRREYLQVH
jgi:hypothetical protein